jgi:hypothetical protein
MNNQEIKKSSEMMMKKNDAKVVKLAFKGELRRFALPSVSVASLLECVASTLGAQLPSDARIRYVDDENDLISFSSDQELIDAFASVAKNNVLKIIVDDV